MVARAIGLIKATPSSIEHSDGRWIVAETLIIGTPRYALPGPSSLVDV